MLRLKLQELCCMYYSHVVLGWSYGAPEVRVMLITGRITSITLVLG